MKKTKEYEAYATAALGALIGAFTINEVGSDGQRVMSRPEPSEVALAAHAYAEAMCKQKENSSA